MILRTRINLKSEKGNAMILALSVILILMAFGTVSLMTSVANVKMGAKYKDWSKDYYDLDLSAEDQVNEVNSQLRDAEIKAQNYMAGHYYSKNDGDIPVELKVNANLLDSEGNIIDAQSVIRSQWQSASDPTSDPAMQKVFMEKTLKILYYYYASDLIDTKLTDSNIYTTTYLKNNTENIDADTNPENDLVNYQTTLFTGGVDLEKLKLIENIKVKDPVIIGKSVSVKLNVLLPKYDVIQQTKKVTFQGNPIWTNALTAAGSIGFEGKGQSKVFGDVFSADKDESLPITDDSAIKKGVYSDSTDVEINGNVYSKGNLHIIGSTLNQRATINVKNYRVGFITNLKDKVFTDKVYIDKDEYRGLFFDYKGMKDNGDLTGTSDQFIQGLMSDKPYIPLLYNDKKGGNIYCNTLSVDESFEGQVVDSGQIKADGNVTTYDDIQMDGLNSEITVGNPQSTVIGNYIGVNSDAENGNPNASSSVINNTALEGSKITLNGKFIVPGTAWAEFKGIKNNAVWVANPPAYQTGESITAKNPDIFSAYLTETNSNHNYDQYTYDLPTSGDIEVSFSLLRGNSDVKSLQLVDFLKGKNVVSNVYSGSNVDGYSLGAAILHQNGATTATALDHLQYGNYLANKLAFDSFKTSLEKIFISKTQRVGTVGKLATSFNGVFVDESAVFNSGVLRPTNSLAALSTANSFVYLEQTNGSTSTLNLSSSQSGMIYCKGDLEITGDGLYKGTIICDGNVLVSGNPTITYDEETIQKVLVADGNARRFFALPGAKMGEDNHVTSIAYDGAVRTDVKRYHIIEWKEVQN